MPDQSATCQICFDDVDPTSAVKCSGTTQHVQCDTCFSRHVRICCSAADPSTFLRSNCKIACPFKGCAATFTDRVIISCVDDETWEGYDIAKRQAALADGMRQEQARMQQQMQELRRTAAEGAAAARTALLDSATRARNAIIEEQLTLLPPCCRRGAVLDWDGCLAVECSQCQQHFCGVCFQFSGSGRDVHRHVRECPLRDKATARKHGYYAARGERAQVLRRLYQQRLDSAFARYQGQPELLHEVLLLMRVELAELGLDVARWDQAAGAAGQQRRWVSFCCCCVGHHLWTRCLQCPRNLMHTAE